MGNELIWHVMMSLDGFIAGPDDAMEWAREGGGHSPLADATRERIGAIVAGRRWYDVATARYDGRKGIYGGKWDGPVVVLTHRPPERPDDPGISFLSGPVEHAVEAARQAAAGRAVGVFGADVARQCLEAGLLDEIVVHVAPLLLGDGVRLHDAPGGEAATLEPRAITRSGDLADLHFAVKR